MSLGQTRLRVFLQGHVWLEGLNTAHLHSLQSAGNDAVEQREIVCHIHSNSMHRDPASHVDADGRDLVSVDVHSRLSVNSLSHDSKHVERVDNALLELLIRRSRESDQAQVGVQILNIEIEVQDGIRNELTRSVVCYLDRKTIPFLTSPPRSIR